MIYALLCVYSNFSTRDVSSFSKMDPSYCSPQIASSSIFLFYIWHFDYFCQWELYCYLQLQYYLNFCLSLEMGAAKFILKLPQQESSHEVLLQSLFQLTYALRCFCLNKFLMILLDLIKESILPVKLIIKILRKPPRMTTIFIHFAYTILLALIHKDWSNVTMTVYSSNSWDCWIIKDKVE